MRVPKSPQVHENRRKTPPRSAEAREESSLQDFAVRAYLGVKEYNLSQLGRDEIHQRYYYHLECLEETPDRWISYEQNPSDGSPAPIELEFYWVEYPDQVPPLSGWLDDYLPQMEGMIMTKTLSDILKRNPDPTPWSEGDNIPWNEPGFSERMLKEHLTQEHDAASRRIEKIEQHVAWIHQEAFKESARQAARSGLRSRVICQPSGAIGTSSHRD